MEKSVNIVKTMPWYSMIENSLRENGWVSPILVGKDMAIIEGQWRVESYKYVHSSNKSGKKGK